MSAPAERVPVIVGIGFAQEHDDDPTQCAEPYRLMVQAAEHAAADAGSARLMSEIESIAVPQGLWQYRNPGALIGAALGCPTASTTVSDLGVLQLTLLSDLCQAIAGGERQLGLITGGEARYRDLRSRITGQPVIETAQADDTPPPDVRRSSNDPFTSDLEGARGLQSPIELFAIIESALRHAEGLDVETHRDRVAELYSRFSAVAAANPHAWRREPLDAAAIRNPTAKNPMIAFPYTKRHCSQWNVNQAVALLVCSQAKAEALGLDPAGWIYPVSGAQSRHVVVLAQQRHLHTHRGTVLCGERAFALAGATPAELTAAELYSCFPAAIRSFARDLRIPDGCPLTVTGSMAYAGGPFNHFSLYGVARMAEVLRDGDGSTRRLGLVSNLSGIFGKQGCTLLSTTPGAEGYRFADVTDDAAAQDPPAPLDAAYTGPATVAGYTVVYAQEQPTHAIAVCDTPHDTRTVARTDDVALAAAMTRAEYCGRPVVIRADGSFVER